MNNRLGIAMNLPLNIINKMAELMGRNPQYNEFSDLELLLEAEKELGWDY